MKLKRENLTDLPTLFFKSGWAVRMVNLITLYRIVMAPVLLYLAYTDQFSIFKWLLVISFLTDAVDGHLARKYKATSILGAKLDSIGDDLTVLVGVVALYFAQPDFIQEQAIYFIILLSLFFIQFLSALIRYGKVTSFHTNFAKIAAVLQGLFLCAFFLFGTPWYFLFYATFLIMVIELIEETILVYILPEWQTDVSGVYGLLKTKTWKNHGAKIS